MKNRLALMLAAILGVNALPALAEVSISGFGTIGYARSDQSFAYQRFVDNGGTFKRDSAFGVQLDAQLTPQIAVTVQGKVAPSMSSDNGWDPTLAWAFVSWRPTNDWLVRLGKLRVPSYLNAENMDVGTTFDMARMPPEVYSTTPTADFIGASFNKSWNLDDNELNLDGYWGKAKSDWRFYFRDTLPGVQNAGPFYWPIDIESKGLLLTLLRDENTYRVGVHKAVATVDKPFPVTFPYVAIMPGVGYYQVADSLPGPGVPTTQNIDIGIVNLGADVGLGNDFRLAGEYVRRVVKNTDIGPDTQSAYLSLRKRIDKWTPYVTYAVLRSQSKPLEMQRALNSSSVPAFIPGAALVNASQRAGADGIIAYDQYSTSLGVSYAMSPTSKLKADWTRVHIGDVSSMVDTPANGGVRRQDINILSLSYNFVF
ncbi:MAG: hypothetical protein KGZ83_13485 [Sulfuricella sp.]|nr:hypothetical protein [Sulfuricella sp.]